MSRRIILERSLTAPLPYKTEKLAMQHLTSFVRVRFFYDPLFLTVCFAHLGTLFIDLFTTVTKQSDYLLLFNLSTAVDRRVWNFLTP